MTRITKAALEAQVAELKTRIVDLEVHAADLEGELKFFQARCDELKDALEAKNLRAQAAAHADIRVSELESELEAHRAPAPAPTRTVGEVLRLALSSKAAAQAAAKDAAMSSKRCTRVIQLPEGNWAWEYYGKKAA
jgi:predicted RNase H-like nuclease (RuvC/YqgF family)